MLTQQEKNPYNYFLERKRRRKSLLLQIWIGSKCNLSREEIVLHRTILSPDPIPVKENTVFTNNSKRSHLNFRAENKCPNLVQFLSNFWREIICWFSNTVYRFWWKPRLSHRLVSGSSAGFFLKKKENKKYTTDTYMQTSRYTS